MKFLGAYSLLIPAAAFFIFAGCTPSGASSTSYYTSPLQKDSLYQASAKSGLPALPIQQARKQLSAGYSASIEGTGSDVIGSISISGNVGNIQLNGAILPTFIQENIPWTDMGYTLYQGMALDESHFYVYWVYCQSGKISSIYVEGVGDQALENETATGKCDSTVADTSFEVSVPDIALKPIQPIKGYEIDGEQVYLSSATGLGIVNIPVLGERYLFAPFSRVDCSKCGQGGWQELHSMFWNESMTSVYFGIIYLKNQMPSEISIDYTMGFPSLERTLDGTKIQSIWSKPTP